MIISVFDKYTMITKQGKPIVVEMELTGECIEEEEMQEALHFIAQKSKQFYLKAGNEINDKLSKKEEKFKIAEEIAKLELQCHHLQEQMDNKQKLENEISEFERQLSELSKVISHLDD